MGGTQPEPYLVPATIDDHVCGTIVRIHGVIRDTKDSGLADVVVSVDRVAVGQSYFQEYQESGKAPEHKLMSGAPLVFDHSSYVVIDETGTYSIASSFSWRTRHPWVA